MQVLSFATNMEKLKALYDLPVCLSYKNPERDCHKLHSDDWDELEDSCQNCSSWKYNYVRDRERWGEEIDVEKIKAEMK